MLNVILSARVCFSVVWFAAIVLLHGRCVLAAVLWVVVPLSSLFPSSFRTWILPVVHSYYRWSLNRYCAGIGITRLLSVNLKSRMPKYSLLWVCLFLAWVAVCQVTWIHILPQHLMMWFFKKDWYIWKAEGDRDPPFLTHVPSACRCRGQAGTGDQEPGASTWGQNWSAFPLSCAPRANWGSQQALWDGTRTGWAAVPPAVPRPLAQHYQILIIFFHTECNFFDTECKKSKIMLGSWYSGPVCC